MFCFFKITRRCSSAAKGTSEREHFLVPTVGSVFDPYSLNPGPDLDPAKNLDLDPCRRPLNPDPDPCYIS